MRHPLRSTIAVSAAVALAILLSLAAPAAASERSGFVMDVLVDGVPLAEYAARGRTYIEALRGREYTVRLANRTDDRVAVALSVDGMSSIDARTTSAASAAKWVLEPWEEIVIEGWQTTSGTARRFFFTTEEGSYGAWMGKKQNLGLVTAAFFRERRPRPRPYVYDDDCRGCSVPKSGEGRDRGAYGRESQAQPAPAPEASDSAAPSQPPPPRAQRQEAQPRRKDYRQEEPKEYAATGIGREVENDVVTVSFDAQSSPATVLEVRYEFRNALVALGVLPREPHREASLRRRERARGFTDTGFAPDPYRR